MYFFDKNIRRNNICTNKFIDCTPLIKVLFLYRQKIYETMTNIYKHIQNHKHTEYHINCAINKYIFIRSIHIHIHQINSSIRNIITSILYKMWIVKKKKKRYNGLYFNINIIPLKLHSQKHTIMHNDTLNNTRWHTITDTMTHNHRYSDT